MYFEIPLIIPKVKAVPKIVEIVAEITAMTMLFLIDFNASSSLNNSINHFHVIPCSGKLYPSPLFHAKIKISIIGAKMYMKKSTV